MGICLAAGGCLPIYIEGHKNPDVRRPWFKPGIVLTVRIPVQKVIVSLLIVFMLNTLSWSVSAVAFADWMASEQLSQQSDDRDSNAPDSGFPDNCSKHCNEGCHVFSHLQGLVQSTPVYPPTLDSFVIPHSLKAPGDRSPDGLYRPPRSSVLA